MLLRGLALLSSVALLTGCQNCPLIGCGPALELELVGAQGPVPQTVVSVELELDGEPYAVHCIPGRGCQGDDPTPLSLVQGQFTDDSITLELGRGGDAPQTVWVRVTIDDEVLAEEELQPSYEESGRGGEEACGTCSRAEAELELVSPSA